MAWSRWVVAGAVIGSLLGGTACDSGAPPEPSDREKRKAEREAKKKAMEEAEKDDRPPPKVPRAPFLALPEGAGESLAKDVLSKGKERKLAFAAQRGPFGSPDAVLVVWTEPSEVGLAAGGVVLHGSVAHALPFDNPLPLESATEVVWAGSERGWEAVVLMQRRDGEQLAQANQVFFWDGKGFVRDEAAEKKVSTYTSPDAIRQALM